MEAEMDTQMVSMGNNEFAVIAGLIFCEKNFQEAVLQSLHDGKVLYPVNQRNYTGYISIIFPKISGCGLMRLKFAKDIRDNRFFFNIAMKIQDLHFDKKDLSGGFVVLEDEYKCIFSFEKYERDAEHGFELVSDLSDVQDNEKIGRILKVVIVPR
ncbi:MAG TPA: hypothetical protein DDY52_05605 [Candidatus Moranbacteria bacterium]|nr:MAG: hypothetical protein UR51_C0002G0139 [Candidatus Moranbacteria bacterium GW2011_GWF1_34_10]HBI17586.1 hypothetical protein [Candidatus Moranbacteria bacterium]